MNFKQLGDELNDPLSSMRYWFTSPHRVNLPKNHFLLMNIYVERCSRQVDAGAISQHAFAALLMIFVRLGMAQPPWEMDLLNPVLGSHHALVLIGMVHR